MVGQSWIMSIRLRVAAFWKPGDNTNIRILKRKGIPETRVCRIHVYVAFWALTHGRMCRGRVQQRLQLEDRKKGNLWRVLLLAKVFRGLGESDVPAFWSLL